ncbi:MAG: DUF1353 domain-containing protein [Spirochaetales bacterium]|jgi:hypothetical protein|nr:DUF1353 domain-containing protein [Spirochaetales bacterium]
MAPDLYYKTTEDVKLREVTRDWSYKGETVPMGFRWDGSSSPRLLWVVIAPWKNPKASCWHDWKCGQAKNKAERKQADKDFKELVGSDGNVVEKQLGYMGVRIGAFFGVGNNF